ncbi:cilia- and flagella-associated protein 54 [Sardina pilchardus]|uniref:cilia- and flagella-associated protein 54 n=1 Tax=Sardina pilchardus TaxID=27697 RepID=UPI002E12516C
MEPLPACYYGKIDKKNPVISAFDGEIKEFKSCIKRIRDSTKYDQNTYVRGSKLLFEIWNKYKPRLPTYYYDQHVLQIADFLFSNKLYHLAQWQGYGRYLCEHGDMMTIDGIKDVDHFKCALFPDGFNTNQAKLTFQALQGQCLCTFYLERARGREPSLDSIQKLLSLLGFLRIMMQAVLPQENLCWLVYNASLYVYDICRYLMSVSRSSQALEFLLWTCVCLETSIPLLSPRFLAWRTTLYCAVCQCYYEGQAGVHAEVFARRALGKVSELANLEHPDHSTLSKEDQKAFKEATVKLAIMVFKRSVYEPRRKPKSSFRPKTKNCLKDATSMPWPRNHTERILLELFEGNAAQFLAVLEALWDSTRRPLQTGGPDEPDTMDVALELMSAGVSLLSGGTTISVDAAVKFVKLLFRYEQWDMFKHLTNNLQTVLANQEGPEMRRAEVELTLLTAVDLMQAAQRHKHLPKESGMDDPPERDRLLGAMLMSQELMDLFEVLHASVCESSKDVVPDGDLVLDLVLLLWNKCKLAFQRAQARHSDPSCYLGKMDSQDKWVKALFLLNDVAEAFNLAVMDPVVVAEMTLRLALVLESSAENVVNAGRTAVTSDGSILGSTPVEKPNASVPPAKCPAERQLQLLYDILERGLEAVCDGNTRQLPCDGSSVCDMAFMQRFDGSARASVAEGGEAEETKSPAFTLASDLHVELLAFLHRAALKLTLHCSMPETVIVEKIGKSKVSRALYLMQKALLQYRTNQRCTKKLLEEALSLVEKAEAEERRLFLTCAAGRKRQDAEEGCRVPPPPVLLSRTNHTMIFKLAPFSLEKQVSWYQILGREADGINLKVRLGDCHLLGTGVMVPAKGERLFRIEGLQHNQKYIFAVAAYDAQAKMVGQSIGESTKPILASAPLSMLMVWAHLAQVAYQTGQQALVKKTCNQLWGHFTRPPPENTSATPQTPEGLAQTRLCVELLNRTSPLLHQFVFSSIFMQTEIHIQEGALFCDSLCDQGPLIWGQKARLAECERMLVALDLAMWLNDSCSALQAVVGCYGLLAPLIYHQIPSEDVLQIVIKCLMVLQEISGVVKKKRNAETAESLQHMVACMTYYVVKGLRLQKETRAANTFIEQGKKLLTDITDKSLLRDDNRKAAGHHGDEEVNEILRSLDCMKLKKQQPSPVTQETALPWNRGMFPQDLTGYEDSSILYTVIETQNIKYAFRDVMRFKRKPGFMEFVVLALQKALQENQLELLLHWGQEALHWLGRRDEELVIKKAQIVMPPSADHFTRKFSVSEKKERELLQKKKMFALKAQKSERECKVLDVLLHHLTLLVRRQQHRRRLRLVCSEEWVWRCHVNLIMARAHLMLLYRSLSQQSSAPQLCYSQLPWALFSLPHTGSLVRWRSGPQSIRSPDLCVAAQSSTNTTGSPRASSQRKGSQVKGSPPKGGATQRNRTQAVSGSEDTGMGESDPDGDPDSLHIHSEHSAALGLLHSRSPMLQQDVLSKAGQHLRRAMVLAHRGGHWTSLQRACGLLWDQVCTFPPLLRGRGADAAPSPSLGLDQVYSTFTPLLSVACELLMDMMDKLQLWKVYAKDEQDAESSLHFSRTLDDSTRVDLRWLKTLVLSTLELLYYQAKWEMLAHLALTYNFDTRERYTHIVTPLLVYAQRRLLDRIAAFGGPRAPQPHHTQTTEITGNIISCRNYVGAQITCVWNVKTRLSGRKASITTTETSQMKRAMSLVSVPLDVEDTLRCFRESLERGHHTLLSFQHSRTLLLLLLAYTQPSFEVPFCKDTSAHSTGRVEFSGMVYTPPSASPPDLSTEDFSSLGSVCLPPLPPSQTPLVLSALNSNAKPLQTNNLNSLRAQTLHDLGNLHFYKGNRRAALSFWAKALDSSLQGSGVLEAWDGVSWDGLSPQQVLKQAGIWGCLQGATLAAKIAQYILISDISQRTKCCLLSAHLFKSLLQASLPHPQANLLYSSYSVEGDLIPGLDLFGDPERGSLSATVSSLGFLCHWLYTAGHYITVLPLLCLYLHFCKMCKDPHLTVRGRILKVRALTELGMFSQALKEVRRLVNADNVPLNHSFPSQGEKTRVKIKFFNNKTVADPANLQCVEELLTSKESAEVSLLYGPLLCQWLLLARVQLTLALSERIHDLPEPLGPTVVQDSETTQPSKTPHGQSGLLTGPQELSPGRVKALLLREACAMLDPVLRSTITPPTEPEGLELVVEAGLLQSQVYLQQGKASTSADQAVCTLRLLQEAAVLQASAHGSPSPGTQSSVLRLRDPRQGPSSRELPRSPSPHVLLDSPRAVEARERMGPSLWLRCRLAAVKSLVAHLPDTAILPGVDSSEEAECVLREGLQEAEQWGCVETHAALLLLGVRLDTHLARPREYSTVLLQETVSLLSGRSCVSLGGGVTLARATLLLSDLRGSGGQALLLLTQRLLQQQLSQLGESVDLGEAGRVVLPSAPGLRNTHHPQLALLATTTFRLGHCLLREACVKPAESVASAGPPCQSALDVLQSALQLCQALGSRQHRLEADILFCMGLAERSLLSQNDLQAHDVAETFLKSINICMAHCPNLQHIQRCYLEMAGVYLHQWEKIRPDPVKNPSAPSTPKPKTPETPKLYRRKKSTTPKSKTPDSQSSATASTTSTASTPSQKRQEQEPNRMLTDDEIYLLFSWVCLRAANKTLEADASCAQLSGTLCASGDDQPVLPYEDLPDFISNDLLKPCGGIDVMNRGSPQVFIDAADSSQSAGSPLLTWVHLAHYHTCLTHLLSLSASPVVCEVYGGLMSLAEDSGLCGRLSQLQAFLSSHLPTYRDTCTGPQPPNSLLLQPQLLQQNTDPPQSCPDSSRWPSAAQQELLIQWHRPALIPAHATQNKGQILLFYGMNQVPLSAGSPAVSAVEKLRVGQRLVCLDKLLAVHAQLSAACVGMTEGAAPSTSTSTSTSTTPRKKGDKKADKGEASCPRQQMLLEKTRQCCAEIRRLLCPLVKSAPAAEVPFEVSWQTLCDLERCFNPTQGATLSDKGLVTWLLSLLGPSEEI